MEKEIDKKGIFKALIFALLLAFVGIGILGWQYRRMESEQLPALEERLEQKSAEAILERFMHARIQKNEKAAMSYLNERSVEGAAEGMFLLLNNMERYEILSGENTSDNEYRYLVKIYEEGGMNDFIEIIILVKILDQYYIDSVQIAG
jgi:hypothetical protein